MKDNLVDKIKKIIRRVSSIVSAGLMLMLPSSDASNSKDVKPDVLDSNNKNFSDTLQEENTVNYELGKIIEPDQLDDSSTINSEIFTTTANNNEQIHKIDSNNSTPNINNNKDLVLYNKLLNELNYEFDKKNFPEISYKYFKGVLDNTFKNYDDWQQISKDLPSKEEYIKNTIINNIKNINNLYFYPLSGSEAQNKINNGQALGSTDKNFNITMIYDDSNNEEKFQNDIERFSHELAHVGQKNIVFNSNYFNGNEYLKNIIIEGGASSQMKYSNPLKTEKTAANVINFNDYKLEYKSDNGEGYFKEMNLYNNLMYFAGYDSMEKVKNGSSLGIIKSSIENKYGQASSDKIFSELKNLYNSYNSGNKEGQMQSAINLQKEFLKCIENDISQLKSKQDVIRYTNIYRAYKINNLAKLYKNDIDFTNEFFEIEKLDQKLSDKILNTKAFSFSNNELENKNAIKCLLYTTTESFPQTNKYYDGVYVPSNLQNVKYLYENGNLILNYDNVTEVNSANRNLNISMNVQNNKVTLEEDSHKYSNLTPIINENSRSNEDLTR